MNSLKDGQNEKYAFCAILSRMKYIKRWVLMRNTRQESLSEHVVDVQVVGHILCLLARQEGLEVREAEINLAALYHDISEIVTGDMPSPMKYKRANFRDMYKKIELECALNLLDFLPEDIAGGVEKYVTCEHLTDVEKKILKSADLISGMIKCIEEHQAGNTEFDAALGRLQVKVAEMAFSPALTFVEKYLPNYYSSLDALISG